MKLEQQNLLKTKLASLGGRERKELSRQAADMRAAAQKKKDAANARWTVEQWMLELLSKVAAVVDYSVQIVESHGAHCHALVDGEMQRFRVHPTCKGVVPGDYVRADGDWVVEVFPRRTMLSRRDPHLTERQLAIVANVDVVVIVVSCVAPPLHPRLIDRYLAAIWRGGAAAAIVMNKVDLQENLEEDRRKLDPYREMGIPVFETSKEQNVDHLREFLAGKLCAFVGHSGVGKSTLVNGVIADAHADTGSVSDGTSKGRHTTTASTLRVDGDIRLIDTPGVREFGVDFDSPQEIADCFREFPAGCKYPDCKHLDEVGCAVVEGVQSGVVSRARYDSYRRLLADAFPQSMDPPDPTFTCRNCGVEVSMMVSGTKHRNHCPMCLHSVHLDDVPGDRLSACRGVMEPVSVWVRKGGEWAIIHRCRTCGALSSNRIASDDNEMLLLSTAVKPISLPPFPLDRLVR